MIQTNNTNNQAFFKSRKVDEKKQKPLEYYNNLAADKYPELKLKLDKIKELFLLYLKTQQKTQEEEILECVEELLQHSSKKADVSPATSLKQTRVIERICLDKKIPKEIILLVKDSINKNKDYTELITLPLFKKAIAYFELE